MRNYKVLQHSVFAKDGYEIVPIRSEDRYNIMQWRNEQIYHLRQDKPLTKETQDRYFDDVIPQLFHQDKPSQLLFSFLRHGKLIGYGGLVHINWVDRNAEISFIMNTELEKEEFEWNWSRYLELIEDVAFYDLNFHKIFTYAFDLRPHFFKAIEKAGYYLEATLFDHACFESVFVNVLIHSKINKYLSLRLANERDVDNTYEWATNDDVRKYSFSKNVIQFDEHIKWFKKMLNDTNCVYFLMENVNDEIVGSIRFNISGNRALLSFLIDPKYFGKGYGNELLTLGINRLRECKPDVEHVIGEVMHENIASNKLFNKQGFTVLSEDTVKTVYTKRI